MKNTENLSGIADNSTLKKVGIWGNTFTHATNEEWTKVINAGKVIVDIRTYTVDDVVNVAKA